VVEEKGLHSIEKFLIARRLMYWQVYLHKTVLSSELMLVNILKRAKELRMAGDLLFATPAFDFFLSRILTMDEFVQDENCLTRFLQLDDNDIISSVKVWASHPDPILSDLCQRLNGRKLFKVLFFSDHQHAEIQEFKKSLSYLDEMSNVARPYYFLEDETSNRAYNTGDEKIKILYKNGQVKEISQVQDTLISAGLLLPIKKHYICYLRQ
jgi:HD superfamily phosphohydrolase